MDPIEFFQGLGVEYALHGEQHHTRDGWIQLKNCPGCQSDNYHLGFNLAGRYFVCWRCGGMKTVFVLHSLGAERKQIAEFFAGMEIPELISRPAGKLVEPKYREALRKAHRQYLKERKYDPDELVRIWELEGIGVSPELAWRIYIPLVEKGRRVSWTTRALGNRGQRYVSAAQSQESVPHKHCIYGGDLARHSLVIVEGPTDAWRIGPGAGALFGTAFTTAQVRKISRFPYRYILFDNEALAQRQARNLAEQLAAFPGETTVLECDAEDPGQLSAKSVRQLRRLARLGELRQ